MSERADHKADAEYLEYRREKRLDELQRINADLIAALQTVCDSVERWNARACGIGIFGPPATVLETARQARKALWRAKGT